MPANTTPDAGPEAHRPWRVPALALLLGLLAGGQAGCGGGGDTETATAPPQLSSATQSPSPIAAPLAAPGRWVVMGSSTAAGIGASPGLGWTARVAAETAPLQVSLGNLARSGLVSTEALPAGTPLPPDRPPPDTRVNLDRALAEQPTLLLLSFPTNDTARGLPAAETLAHLRLLRDRAAAATPPAAVLVLSSQPRDGFNASQRAQAEELDRLLAQAFGPCFVRTRLALSDTQGRIAAAYSAGDGIHLNNAGHALVAEQVMERLRAGDCVRLQP
jgi:acyl-CoA thioesterase-1